jgi:hypothetical protein
VTPCCEHALFLHECFFDFVFCFVCDRWQNRAICPLQVLGETTKTLEMLREAVGEHSLSRTAVFKWHSCFKVGQVSIENDKCSGWPSTSKTAENIEKIQ